MKLQGLGLGLLFSRHCLEVLHISLDFHFRLTLKIRWNDRCECSHVTREAKRDLEDVTKEFEIRKLPDYMGEPHAITGLYMQGHKRERLGQEAHDKRSGLWLCHVRS